MFATLFRLLTAKKPEDVEEPVQLVTQDGQRLEALRELSQEHDEAGDFGAVVELLSDFIASDQTVAWTFNDRAMALLELNREDDAIADFRRALDLDPKFPGARPWLARTYASLKRHDESAKEWIRYLEDHPDGQFWGGVSPQCWADCARQFSLADQAGYAIEVLEEYFAIHSKRVTDYACHETAPMRLLAELLEDQGRQEEARVYRQMARFSPHRKPADI